MSAYLAAVGNGQQFFTPTGVVLVGGYIATYVAGTTTPVNTYIDSTGTTTNSNPIPLGSDGRPPQEIWIASGTLVKFQVLTSAMVVVPNATYDFIPGINDPTLPGDSGNPAEWVITGLTPTPVDATHFTLTGNQTAIYQVGRRVKATVTAGTIYGSITASTFGSTTLVTVLWDNGGAIDGGLSAVNVGFLSATNPSVPQVLSNGIDNTPIGVNTPNVGYFTNLFANNLTVTNPFLVNRSQAFLSPGTFSFTVPTGITSVFVSGCGAGGGGGAGHVSVNSGGGGGGGEWVLDLVETVTPADVVTIVVGALGAGGADSTDDDGADGGNSSFGTVVFHGGTGGESGLNSGAGGVGGSTTGGLNPGTNGQGGTLLNGGMGGGGYSPGGPGGTAASGSGLGSYGAAGGGGIGGFGGGNGGNGFLLIKW